MASLFVKFEFQGKIKKVRVCKDQFTWINICEILFRTFSIPEDCIRLSYKDPDDDLITACDDDDLIEAHKLISLKQILKFYVSKTQPQKQEKQVRPSNERDYVRANSMSTQDNSLNNTLTVKKDHSEGQIPLQEKKDNILIVVEQPEPQVKPIELSFEDIEQTLAKLFQTKEAKQEMQQLRARIGLSKLSENRDQQAINIDLPEQKIADYIAAAFKKSLFESMESHDLVEKDLSEDKSSNPENLNETKGSKKGLLDISLKESIYENSYNDVRVQKSVEDPQSKGGNSASFCKDLSSTHGVKLTLKFENGKMRLMSIPMHEYSIIESAEDSEKRSNIRL